MSGETIILGVIGSDCHAVGNRILQGVFSDAGFKVVNLGVMVSREEFADAAVETGASAILVSSLYGHGEIDCDGFRDLCIERGIGEILLYVGGNLVIGKQSSQETEEKFRAMGFDRVFGPDADLEKAVELLREDLAREPVLQDYPRSNR